MNITGILAVGLFGFLLNCFFAASKWYKAIRESDIEQFASELIILVLNLVFVLIFGMLLLLKG